MSQRPLILVVDDETKIRRLLTANLEMRGYDVVCAADGESALEVFEKTVPAPDLVILDVMMPGIDGFGVLDALRLRSSVPVVLLSARAEHADKIHALRHGADDYVTKPFSVDELLARIEAVLRRCRGGSETETRAAIVNGPIEVDLASRRVTVAGDPCVLTDTEYRLLLVFLKHPETVLTHDALIRAVWGPEAIGETGALRVTLARVRKKLAQAGLTGVIVNYSGVGYIMSDLRADDVL